MTVDKHTLVATAGSVELDVIRGALECDDTRVPFIQGTLTIATPADPATVDPASPARIHLALGQQFDALGLTRDFKPLWAGYTTTANLAAYFAPATVTADAFGDRVRYDGDTNLRTGTGRELDLVVMQAVDNQDGTTDIEVASLEALLEELPFFNYVKDYYPQTTLRASLAAVLATLASNGHNWPTEIVDGFTDPSMVLQKDPDGIVGNYLALRPGDSLWDAYAPTMQQANLIFRDLGEGGISIVDADYTTSDEVELTEGDGGSLIMVETERSRRSPVWGDAVLVVYDEGPLDFYLASASSNTGWNRPLVIQQRGYSPLNQFGGPGGPDDGGWSVVADQMRSRAVKRKEQVPLTAVNNYFTFPRAQLTVTFDGTTYTGTVQAVSFDIAETWEMRVTAINLEATP